MISVAAIAPLQFLEECRNDPEAMKSLEAGEAVLVSTQDMVKGEPVPDPPELGDLPVGFILRYDLALLTRWGSPRSDESDGERKWRYFCDAVQRLARARRFDVDVIVWTLK